MYDLLTIGDITLDLFFKGESLTEDKDRFALAIGGKYRVEDFYFSLGGCGANVAVGTANIGLSTGIVSVIGDNPFKGIILQKIISSQVSIRELIYVRDFINISTVLIAKNGDRSIIHYVQDNLDAIPTTSFISSINKTKFLYLGNLPHLKAKIKETILLQAKRSKITSFLTVGSNDCRNFRQDVLSLVELADFFALNTHEFAELVQKKYSDIDFKQGFKMLNTNRCRIIVTDGNRGSYLYYKGKSYFHPPAAIQKIIDTTGAGDAYLSGFIYGYFKTGNIEISMSQATDYAGRVISKIGAQ
ncbi:hypothetical protein A3C23_03760 [Candidatus Roizmanbacteria bacterium RIFCSPHIGHO2_02_FULL_37_13b]|nr:MAG: hypothetical protein A3C23_03760 [Candidatus Roizmanbacteria bacterium RIFCSPHIGHO2_02_FULL_37_13b]